MSNAINEIAKLSFDNVKWVTILRNRLCENGSISGSDLMEAYNEVLSTDSFSEVPNIPVSTSNSHTTRDNILYRLNKNSNVAGLLDNQELVFSPYFTLVFGKNGTGKSTYYKLLKDAFHSNQDIKSNIYSASPPPSISANISYTKKNAYLKHQRSGGIADFDAMETENMWTPSTRLSSKVKFCDAQILGASLSKKDAGWDIDKFKLGCYDELREGVEDVEAKVVAQIKELEKVISEDKVLLTTNLKSDDTESFKYILENSTGKALTEIIAKAIVYKLPDDFESGKQKEVANSNVTVSEITNQIESVKVKINTLTTEQKKLHNRIELLNNVNILVEKVKKHNELSAQRNNNAFDKYSLLFSVTGDKTKDDSLISLLKSIAETALKYGYKDYPGGIDKCFYCNQNLSDESKRLIEELNKLVTSTLEAEITQSEKGIKESSKWIAENVLREQLRDDIVLEKISEIYSVESKQKLDFNSFIQNNISQDNYQRIKNLLDLLNTDVSLIDFNQLDLQFLYDALGSEISCLTIEQKELKEKADGIQTLVNTAKKNLNRMLDDEFLCKNIGILTRLKENIDLATKYSSLSFQGFKVKISNDKSRVEKILVRNNYDSIFSTYTQRFNLEKRDKIVRNFSISGGYTKIEPRITTDAGIFPVTGILSEGEAKIYALCDWLTELSLENKDTLIFDDPITSLDHRNIEKVAIIIAELSLKYQVIVFTHNHEFYDRLIKKTLGTKPIEKASCEICGSETDGATCTGLHSHSGVIRKCGNYFKVEYTTQPGKTNRDIDFFRFNYDQRIADVKYRIVNGNDADLKTDIRTTINSFFENYVLADIKRDVFKGEDLIHNWKKFHPIDEADYNTLMEIHNKLSGKSIHEPSIEVNTELDILDYKNFVNELISIVNKLRGTNPIDLIP